MASAANSNQNSNQNQNQNNKVPFGIVKSSGKSTRPVEYSGTQEMYEEIVNVITKKGKWFIKKQKDAKYEEKNTITPFALRKTPLQQILT